MMTSNVDRDWKVENCLLLFIYLFSCIFLSYRNYTIGYNASQRQCENGTYDHTNKPGIQEMIGGAINTTLSPANAQGQICTARDEDEAS